MQKREGTFVLFDLPAFGTWLARLVVHRDVRRVQNHHTWSPSYRHFERTNHFALLRGMEHAHLERGFAEIGQNLTTFPDGTVALCRALDRIPAGIRGANTEGLCIEHVGNFDAGADVMAAAQRDTIVGVNALLCRKLGLVPSIDTMVYHHWYDLVTGTRRDGRGTTKSCPGTAFFGGNSVEAATASFVPAVAKALEVLGGPGRGAPAPLFRARVVSETPLNVRSRPAASATKVGELARGVVVKVYQATGNWRRIHSVKARWVNGRFLRRIAVN